MGEIAAGIGIILIVLPFLFSALKESGRIKAPTFGRKSKTFRQFPLHEEGGDY